MADRGRKQAESPVDLYIEYSGSEGIFTRWDKEANGGNGANVPFPITNAILLTDERNGVSGFSEQHNNGIFSNEVSNVDDELVVKVFQKRGKPIEIARGIWQDIKGACKVAGGKYTKCVYFVQDGMMIHAKMAGCAFGGAKHYERPNEDAKGGWINFKTKGFMEKTFAVVGTVEGQQNAKAQPYLAPVFSFTGQISKEDAAKAEEQYELLQQFLGAGGHQQAANDSATTDSGGEELTDTSNWQEYEIEPGVELSQFGLDALISMRDKRNDQELYDEAYDMICAGIQEFQQAQTPAQQAPAQQAPAQPTNESASAPANPNADLPVAEWESFTMPSGNKKMGQLSDEELNTALEWVDANQQCLDMRPYLVKAIEDRATDAAASAEAEEAEPEAPAGMPDCF